MRLFPPPFNATIGCGMLRVSGGLFLLPMHCNADLFSEEIIGNLRKILRRKSAFKFPSNHARSSQLNEPPFSRCCSYVDARMNADVSLTSSGAIEERPCTETCPCQPLQIRARADPYIFRQDFPLTFDLIHILMKNQSDHNLTSMIQL